MKVYNFLTAIVALLASAGISRAAQIPSVPSPGLAVPTMPVPTISAPTIPSIPTTPLVPTQPTIPIPTTPSVPTTPTPGGGAQVAVALFTEAVLEPNGSVAACFATNLDSVARILVIQIIDSNGVNVTQTSSCGAGLASGVTCDATAHFANNSPLRCVVGTSGNVTTLRGTMMTSTSGMFPFTSPAHLTVPAH